MKYCLSLLALFACEIAWAQLPEVSFDPNGGFALVENGEPAKLWVEPTAPSGLKLVAEWYADDMGRVSGKRAAISVEESVEADSCVLVGILGTGGILDQLVAAGKIDGASLTGKWESYSIQVVEEPVPGMKSALVIAGSDKRGAIYGLLDLSRAAGVSPWYWWADVPTQQQKNVSVSSTRFVQDEPGVRYRGIFLNDEAPALANWAQEKFGGCNSKFYRHVFELILRLRGNFLWPAMWGRSLFDDDGESQRLADELGVVLSTSHHEPMMRAHVEWQRYGKGPWDYARNPEILQEFWREGIRRMGNFESVVTLAMRGDGDEPMSENANIALLEKIVRDQRKILAEELNREVTEQPQVWALYKEVQEYYDRGMRVPDDVILLLCDDNWGNVRRLPRPGQAKHPGGYGLYYHFDYVGDPRNYKWLNTNNLPRVWEQMRLTWEHGVDKIWVVNVGDLKPMEQPIDFFLSLAWDPDSMPATDIAETLKQWQINWAAEQFSQATASEIAEMLAEYGQMASRRKPELLTSDTYSLGNYREWDRIVAHWHELAERAERTESKLPSEFQAAYYQLVLHPILAMANVHDLYYTVAKNRHHAAQGRSLTNSLADEAEGYFARDEELTARYHQLEQGKWNHMMSQTHIGYTYWQQPEEQAMPEVKRLAPLPQTQSVGIEVEGRGQDTLPEFVPGGRPHWFELFSKGEPGFHYSIDCEQPWVEISSTEDDAKHEERIEVSIDWSKLPAGKDSLSGKLQISTSDGNTFELLVPVRTLAENATGFVEANGYVSVLAGDYTRAEKTSGVQWQAVPRLGRTGTAMITAPSTAESTLPGSNDVYLEYPIHLTHGGTATVEAYLSPTLDFYGGSLAEDGHGIRFAISIDDQEPQIIDMHAERSTPESNPNPWRGHVGENIHRVTSEPVEVSSGNHTLRFWRIDSGVVLQKLLVKTQTLPPSYLGPPPSPPVGLRQTELSESK